MPELIRPEDSVVSVAVPKVPGNLLVVDAANAIQANIDRMPMGQRREINRDWRQVARSLGLASTVCKDSANQSGMGWCKSVWTER